MRKLFASNKDDVVPSSPITLDALDDEVINHQFEEYLLFLKLFRKCRPLREFLIIAFCFSFVKGAVVTLKIRKETGNTALLHSFYDNPETHTVAPTFSQDLVPNQG